MGPGPSNLEDAAESWLDSERFRSAPRTYGRFRGSLSARSRPQKLSVALGQQFIIENRPGAGGVRLPGFDAVQYYGLSAPAGIPRAIVDRLNKELRLMIESEEMSKRIVADGGDPIASTPEEYAANIEREECRWATLIKKLGLKIE
jgi:tripartite-type tricarboxylate transporter receptor subunit TctC